MRLNLSKLARSPSGPSALPDKSLFLNIKSYFFTGEKQDNSNVVIEKLESLKVQLKELNKKLEAGEISENVMEKTMKSLGPGEWDEWIKLDRSVCSFDKKVCQYILIADRLPGDELESYGILGGIHWKFVLDLDPQSDNRGLNQTFKNCKKRDAIIMPHTPHSIKQQKGNLGKSLDLNKTQWVSVNGQYQDEDNEPKNNIEEWEKSYASLIKRFIDTCIMKFDYLKPVICVVLPLRQLGKQIVPELLKSLKEDLGSNDFKFRFVSINEDIGVFKNAQNLETFNIPSLYFESGVRSLLGSPKSKYQLPSRMEGTSIYLEQQEYLSLKENLDILYLGCNEFTSNEDKETRERIRKKHRENFLSGNPISFLSLHYREDARREISEKLVSHIRNVLKDQRKFTSTKIEEISHAPGTGGTTIARRVLWDLHKEYPCAIANISFLNTLSFEEYEEEPSVKALAENIGYLDNLCEVSPIILLDGKRSVVEPLSDQLARKLNTEGKKALLLCCTRSGVSDGEQLKDKDSFKHCSPYKVNVELEDSDVDLEEFKKKYGAYVTSVGLDDACRVFHFPLLAMQKEYNNKLKQIINTSLDELQSNKCEYEVMVQVAFLLRYTELPTPALLIYEVFKRHFEKMDRSYSNIKGAFSDTFLNLMISKTGSYRAPRGHVGQTFESFTLQHPLVAKYVLEHAGRPLRNIVEELIEKKVIFRIPELRPLLAELFIYNKGAHLPIKFSLLIDELKRETSPRIAGNLFSKVAKETNDPNFFSNAARFYSYQFPNPDFEKSEELIQKALAVENISKERQMGVYDTYGTILKIQLTYYIERKKIQNIGDLETCAKQSIEKFHKARDDFHHPKEFTNPLVGEITVWQVCFDWIIKHECQLNSETALKFITSESPKFFRKSISTCFSLLDFIDEILETALHLPTNSTKTRILANECRMKLLQTFGTHRNPNSKRSAAVQSVDVIRTCQELCSKENFAGASAKELKRLQVHYIIDQATKIECLSDRQKVYLIKILKEIVIKEKDYAYSRKLLQIGCLESEASLHLDESLEFVCKWVDRAPETNPYVMYYLYMIFFSKLLEGDVFEYRPKYEKTLEKCKKRSDDNCRRNSPQYFLGRGNEGKMSQLVSKTTLEMEYKKLIGDNHYNVQLDDDFWSKHAGKYLRKCEGKIYVLPSGSPYIELMTGKLKIFVSQRMVGEVNKQFELGDRYSIFIAFSLRGPRAYGLPRIQNKRGRIQISSKINEK